MGESHTCLGWRVLISLISPWIPRLVLKSNVFDSEHLRAADSCLVTFCIVEVRMLSGEHATSSNSMRSWPSKASKASGSKRSDKCLALAAGSGSQDSFTWLWEIPFPHMLHRTHHHRHGPPHRAEGSHGRVLLWVVALGNFLPGALLLDGLHFFFQVLEHVRHLLHDLELSLGSGGSYGFLLLLFLDPDKAAVFSCFLVTAIFWFSVCGTLICGLFLFSWSHSANRRSRSSHWPSWNHPVHILRLGDQEFAVTTADCSAPRIPWFRCPSGGSSCGSAEPCPWSSSCPSPRRARPRRLWISGMVHCLGASLPNWAKSQRRSALHGSSLDSLIAWDRLFMSRRRRSSSAHWFRSSWATRS